MSRLDHTPSWGPRCRQNFNCGMCRRDTSKPLYPIMCGDLGVTAGVVEETLSMIFARAEAWNCVVLLDEADVFLAQRTRFELKRNAVVSVFLRVLEYYRGVLILTTNRVYQTLAIWRMNLNRVVEQNMGGIAAHEDEIMRFADAHLDNHRARDTRWNGRQIRNAFQTALAMAEYDAIEASDEAVWERQVGTGIFNAHLKASHFRTVADASSEFDSYMEQATVATDAGRALMDRDRADNFKRMPPPASTRNQHCDGQWPHGREDEDICLRPRPDPDAQTSQANFGIREFGSTQAARFSGQEWPGTSQRWTGAPDEPHLNPHDPYRDKAYIPNKASEFGERVVPQSSYGQILTHRHHKQTLEFASLGRRRLLGSQDKNGRR
ncbi:hypothetical protein CC86DRAFT_440001 [Ophiobolus disseminans]|uniref:Uncharacterized protein n=1 Tax=Ophiobolus disseminans TaxID=1469910 RepID=A0A6A7A4J1_9PLEO|nr:hypothetical protein CC86DRAFT_440001 [Ophiobolus disseminans]